MCYLGQPQDLLPYRRKLEDYLGQSSCLWLWLSRLDESDVEQVIKIA